jgi:Trk K+ transport system NAD-binding subunit
VHKARAIILCTQNDSLNLQIALKARSFKTDIEVIVRIFDDEFATALHDQFGFTAMSATGRAAPAFAAAAAGVDMTRPITVDGEELSLASFVVAHNSPLVGSTVETIERDFEISIVMVRRNGIPSEYHPGPSREIMCGDHLAVFGCATEISVLAQQIGEV